MKQYEYKEVYENETNNLIDDLNELGKEGWRLVSYAISDGYKPTAILEKSVYEIEPYLELIYKLGLENSHKDLLKFLEDNKEHWITGLMYISDPDIEDQWKTCEAHLDLILEDIKKFYECK